MQGKQAKILTPKQEAALLRYLETTRYPQRDTVLFLLSVKAGLRAKEIAALTWSMVTDAEGQVADTLHLEDRATKGQKGGRSIPLHPQLRAALTALHQARGGCGAVAPGHLLRARPGPHVRHGAALVPPALYVAGLCRVFLPFRTAHLHHPRRPQGLRKPGVPYATCSSWPGMPAGP
jgi:integrase